MPASWLCSLILSHLLSLGSSDRSHNAPTFVSVSMLVDESPYLVTLGHALQLMSHTSVMIQAGWYQRRPANISLTVLLSGTPRVVPIALSRKYMNCFDGQTCLVPKSASISFVIHLSIQTLP